MNRLVGTACRGHGREHPSGGALCAGLAASDNKGMESFPQRLAARLAEGISLAPCREMESELSYGRHAGPAPGSARHAAVLVLLYPVGDDWRLPLTVRPEKLSAHAGQIALPGGMVEPGEASADAALRELHEELGVDPRSVHVIGSMAERYVFVTNFVVTPWVGFTASRPQFDPNPTEVSKVFELSLRQLVDPSTKQSSIRTSGGVAFQAPYFAVDDHQIWGATSMILAQLRELVLDASGDT